MAHERKLLRDAIKARLVAAATVAGSRVGSSRLAPPLHAELPCISVFTDEEVVDEESKKSAPRELKRIPVVAIEAWVAVAKDGAIDDALDAIALEIETAMDQNDELDDDDRVSTVLEGTATDTVLTRTEFGMTAEGSRPMGCVRLEYTCPYYTEIRVEAPEDIFEELDAKTKLGGQVADQSEQHLTDINQEEDPAP